MIKGLYKTIKYRMPFHLWLSYARETFVMWRKILLWVVVMLPYNVCAVILIVIFSISTVCKAFAQAAGDRLRSSVPDRWFLDMDELGKKRQEKIKAWNDYKIKRDGKLGE